MRQWLAVFQRNGNAMENRLESLEIRSWSDLPVSSRDSQPGHHAGHGMLEHVAMNHISVRVAGLWNIAGDYAGRISRYPIRVNII